MKPGIHYDRARSRPQTGGIPPVCHVTSRGCRVLRDSGPLTIHYLGKDSYVAVARRGLSARSLAASLAGWLGGASHVKGIRGGRTQPCDHATMVDATMAGKRRGAHP